MKAPVEFNPLGELPSGWSWQPLQNLTINPKQDVVDGPFGSDLKASEYVSAGVPIARLQNIDRNAFVTKNIRYLTPEKAADLARHEFRPDDILITKLGDPLGKACIVPASIGRGVIVADLVRVRPDESRIDRQYLTYAINSPLIIKQFELHTKGTTRPRVNLSVLRQLPIPVAPREVQGEIVAELEKQFSRLDEAVANLQRVKANLKRYKASVLKAAVEGSLVETEAALARREGRTYETGEQLLLRILEERRAKWSGRGAFSAEAPSESLEVVPEGWAVASVDQLATVVRGGSPRPAGDPRYFGGTVPWITVGSITADETDYLRYANGGLTEAGKERSRFIDVHTLLLTNSGATLGVPKISLIAGCINDGVAALLGVEYPLKHYLVHFLRTRTDALRQVNQGAAQPNLNTTIIKSLLVPLPPVAEQVRVLAEVDRHLSIIREVDGEIDRNLKRSDAMRQSILAKAFGNSSEWMSSNEENSGNQTMETRKLPSLPAPRKSDAEDHRLDLIEILQLHPDGLKVEQLFQEAGYSGDQVDDFYRDLALISSRLLQFLPAIDGKDWPASGAVTIQLKT